MLQENNNAGKQEKGGRGKEEGEGKKRFLENVIKDHTKMLVKANSARLDYWGFNFLFFTALCISYVFYEVHVLFS